MSTETVLRSVLNLVCGMGLLAGTVGEASTEPSLTWDLSPVTLKSNVKQVYGAWNGVNHCLDAVWQATSGNWGVEVCNYVPGGTPTITSLMSWSDATNPRIAVDSDGKRHVVYYNLNEGTTPKIYYRNNISGSWTAARTVATPVKRSYGGDNRWPVNAMAVDGSGKIYVAYNDNATMENAVICTSTNQGVNWSSTTTYRDASSRMKRPFGLQFLNTGNDIWCIAQGSDYYTEEGYYGTRGAPWYAKSSESFGIDYSMAIANQGTSVGGYPEWKQNLRSISAGLRGDSVDVAVIDSVYMPTYAPSYKGPMTGKVVLVLNGQVRDSSNNLKGVATPIVLFNDSTPTTEATARDVSMAIDNDGFHYVVYSASDGNDDEIYCQVVDRDGNLCGPAQQLTNNTVADIYPMVFFDGKDTLHLVWQQGGGDSTGGAAMYMAGHVMSRGHRLLVHRGIQTAGMAMVAGTCWSDVNMSTYLSGGFTSIDFWADQNAAPVKLASPYNNVPWSRWVTDVVNPAVYSWQDMADLTASELPYLPSMVSIQFWDESDITNTTLNNTIRQLLAHYRQVYPDAISHTDTNMDYTLNENQSFLTDCRPDMLFVNGYPFLTNYTAPGGSPTGLYNMIAKFRQVGLAGYGGDGTTPVPYGFYTQTYHDSAHKILSGSELNLEYFGSLAFGYTYFKAFTYNTMRWSPSLASSLFSGLTDTTPTSLFTNLAGINQQIVHLGPALVRLLSTDLRMMMGRHHGPRTHWYQIGVGSWEEDNTLPTGVTAWSTSADSYMTAISAANPGNYNNYTKDDISGSWTVRLPGDVVIGYFKSLHESFDGPDFNDQKYFMVVNGLCDPVGDAAGTTQNITVDFNFGSSGITGLQRLRRSDGVMENIVVGGSYSGLTWTQTGSTTYRLVLTLDGGIGDLFKYNTGAPFVGASGRLNMAGDASGDGRVDVSDLGILAANYGGTGKTWDLGDFSGDGKVDVSDLGILAAHYGQGSGGATQAGDLPADMKALGLSFDSPAGEPVNTQKTQTEDNPVAKTLGGCGSVGLTLVAGLLLAGLLLVGVKLKD